MIPKQLRNPHLRFVKVEKKNKRAFEAGWQINANYSFDDQKLNLWLEQSGNYGIMGGHGNLIIIDSDIAEISAIAKDTLPPTFTVVSGKPNSQHFYYFAPNMTKNIKFVATEELCKKYKQDKDKLEIGQVQVIKKYVVGPGSVHTSGSKYKIKDDLPIATITREQLLLSFIEHIKEEDLTFTPEDIKKNEPNEDTEIDITKIIDISGLKKRHGTNEFYGEHPVHGSAGTGVNFHVNVKKGIWHCFRHGTGGGALSLIAVKEGIITCSDCKRGSLVGETFIKTLKVAKEKYGIDIKYSETIDWSKYKPSYFYDEVDRKKFFVPKKMADIIKEKIIFATRTKDEHMYYYNSGIYKPDAEPMVKNIVRIIMKNLCKVGIVNESIAAIKDTTHVNQDQFDSDSDYIVLENGKLNVETLELEDFSPRPIFTIKMPVKYDPRAKCDVFISWLEETLKRGIKGDSSVWKMEVIQEMFGYCLLKDVRFQKAFLLFGEKRSGKSTLLFVLTELFGKDNVSNMPLQYISENRFALGHIYNKPVNVHADLSSRALKDTSNFMTITGGDKMFAEQKNKNPFDFAPITKLFFSCNVIPRTPNKNLAFYRRWILVEFPKSIEENEVDETMNTSGKSPLTTPEELSGILNWSIEGLKRLLKNKKFSYPFDEQKIKDMYEQSSDSISSFIYNRIEEDDFEKVAKRVVYKSYIMYCKTNRLNIENPILFGRVFKAVTGCGTGKVGTIPAYTGVKVKGVEGNQASLTIVTQE